MLNYVFKYFSLNRRERNGVLMLLTIVLLLLLLKLFTAFSYNANSNAAVVVELDEAAARLAAQEIIKPENNSSKGFYNNQTSKKDSLFYFDPNTITAEQAVELGFAKKCASMLVNYRNKGGKFYKPTDLQKLYCMDEPFYKKLEPFIIIAGHEKPKEEWKKENNAPPRADNKTIEINSADSLAWMSLRGIGPGYTRRILKYKSLLGGFTSIEQIKEVYYFPDSVYQAIKGSLTVNPALVQKLPVNKVDFKTMVHHPYIKYEGTKCIFALKRGKNIKEEDLVNSSCFEREHLKKLLPYLDFSE